MSHKYIYKKGFRNEIKLNGMNGANGVSVLNGVVKDNRPESEQQRIKFYVLIKYYQEKLYQLKCPVETNS